MNAKHHRDHTTRSVPGSLHRPLAVNDVPREGLDRMLTASESECAAIADDIELPAVRSLTADFRIRPRAGGRFDVTGKLEATITNICVVTLEPFESRVEQPIELAFAPTIAEADFRLPKRRDRDRAEPAWRPPATVPGNDDQEDPADPIIDGTIDLGAVAVEFLALACDPYPRKPGVHFTDAVIGDDEEPSAFAVLQRLRDRS